MVSDLEAAAIYTIRYIHDHDSTNLKQDQCFIFCDAGGVTVDVVGYRIKQLTPNLELEQMTLLTGKSEFSHFVPV
jgi:hypothetical protein